MKWNGYSGRVCEWNRMKNLGGENEKKVGVMVKKMWSGGDWNGVIEKWEKWMKMWSKGYILLIVWTTLSSINRKNTSNANIWVNKSNRGVILSEYCIEKT